MNSTAARSSAGTLPSGAGPSGEACAPSRQKAKSDRVKGLPWIGSCESAHLGRAVCRTDSSSSRKNLSCRAGSTTSISGSPRPTRAWLSRVSGSVFSVQLPLEDAEQVGERGKEYERPARQHAENEGQRERRCCRLGDGDRGRHEVRVLTQRPAPEDQ